MLNYLGLTIAQPPLLRADEVFSDGRSDTSRRGALEQTGVRMSAIKEQLGRSADHLNWGLFRILSMK